MVYLVGLIVGMINEFFKFCDVFPCFSEVKRTKILVEVIVDKVLDRMKHTLSMLK